MILVPGGSRGTRLESWFPKRYVQALGVGLTRVFMRRLMVSSACRSRWSHPLIRKFEWQVASPERKRFLKVRIARSAVLVL